MEIVLLFCVLPLMSSAVFFVSKRKKGAVSLLLLAAGMTATVFLTMKVPDMSAGYRKVFSTGFLTAVVYVDALTVFFLALLNIVALTAFLYSPGYLESFRKSKSDVELSLHHAAYIWLYCAMSGVMLFRDTTSFLLSWEMMTGTTFILVTFEAEKREKLKAAIVYLVQMHVCLFVLLAAFSAAERGSGLSGFDAVAEYFGRNGNTLLFIPFFIGFGMKAGFFPLHSWLPEVHPSAPGNVSGFMSGAVIKTGIYGLFRISSCMNRESDMFVAAMIVLAASAVTGIYGISRAVRQKDIKRLLAYSSIENVGIIGLGLGLGIAGLALNRPALAFAGYAGALLHTFNHSMFKSVLFFSAGTLCKAAHTQIMDKMGGAIRTMPFTAALFLVGSLAACALPPLSGFVSEFVLYGGIFSSLASPTAETSAILLFVVLTLALTGGIAAIAFAKAFGIPFLGECRNARHASAPESKALALPLFLPLLMILFVGFFPFEALKIVSKVAGSVFDLSYSEIGGAATTLKNVSFVMFFFVALCCALLFLRKKILSKRIVSRTPTWGCGYTAPTPKLQYTASSFSDNFRKLASTTNLTAAAETIDEEELFPASRAGSPDKQPGSTTEQLVEKIGTSISSRLAKLAAFQTGNIRHYILLALLFMLLVFLIGYF
jgi:formate hydrogenlyase subunit 3/multisubunit Na+/H+ antiporter MnhD subunit